MTQGVPPRGAGKGKRLITLKARPAEVLHWGIAEDSGVCKTILTRYLRGMSPARRARLYALLSQSLAMDSPLTDTMWWYSKSPSAYEVMPWEPDHNDILRQPVAVTQARMLAWARRRWRHKPAIVRFAERVAALPEMEFVLWYLIQGAEQQWGVPVRKPQRPRPRG